MAFYLWSKYKQNLIPSSHIILYAVDPNQIDLLYKRICVKEITSAMDTDRALEKDWSHCRGMELHLAMSRAIRIRNLGRCLVTFYLDATEENAYL